MHSSVTEYKYKNIICIACENDSDYLTIISEEEALRNSEECLQLKEGCS